MQVMSSFLLDGVVLEGLRQNKKSSYWQQLQCTLYYRF